MSIRRRIRLAGTTLLALALIVLAGAVVVDPMNQRKIRIGSYALQIPKGVTFERTDTGEYRLLLDQKTTGSSTCGSWPRWPAGGCSGRSAGQA
jgi:hypothetical protein